LNRGPPALEASTLPLGYRGGGEISTDHDPNSQHSSESTVTYIGITRYVAAVLVHVIFTSVRCFLYLLCAQIPPMYKYYNDQYTRVTTQPSIHDAFSYTHQCTHI